MHRGDSYELLCWKTTRLSAALMTAGVRAYFDGSIRSTPQAGGGTTYRNMPDEGIARIRLKLAQGGYTHFVD